MTAKEKHATQLFFKGLQVKGQPNTVSPSSASNDLNKSGSDEDPAKLRGKRRASAGHEPSTTILKGQPRELQLPNIIKTKGTAAHSLVIRNESPWNAMKEVFACDLAGPVSIAVHRTAPSRVLAVRAYSESSANTVLRVLQLTQHPNIMSIRDVFKDNGVLYSVGVDFPLTLDHLVACDAFPCELQLASILAQVSYPDRSLVPNW